MNSPSSSSLLHAALDARVKTDAGPVQEACSAVRSALDDYELAYIAEAQDKALAAALKALGQTVEPLPDRDLEGEAETLRLALARMLALLVKPEPASVTPSATAPAPVRVVSPAVTEAAWTLLEEIDEVDYAEQPPIRLGHLLQAQIAECRLYADQLPVGSKLQDNLSSAIRFLGRMRKQYTPNTFINGLAYSARADWAKISRDARGRIAVFDADSDRPLVPRKNGGNGNVKGADQPREGAADRAIPKLPGLRGRLNGTKTLIMYGGNKRVEKLRTIQDRCGLQIEWCEHEPSSPRLCDEVTSRVKGGSVAAVIVLNGFMSHASYKRITETCSAMKVPWAYAERGGVSHVANALSEIEKQCSGGAS